MARPVARLDPAQGIVNVRWSVGKGTLVLEYAMVQINTKGVAPPYYMSGIPWTTDFVDLNNPGVYEVKDKRDEMVFHKNPPYIEFSSTAVGHEGDFSCRGLAFFYLKPLSRMTSGLYLKFVIDTPPVDVQEKPVENTLYWLWGSDFGAASLEENQQNPYSTGDPYFNPPYGTMVLPRAFATAEALARYTGLGVSTWHGVTRTSTGTTLTGGDWWFRLSSYETRTEFPCDEHNVAKWNIEGNNPDWKYMKSTEHEGGFNTPEIAHRWGIQFQYPTLAFKVEKLDT